MIRFTFVMAALQLKAAMQYRWSFLSQVLFMALNDLFLLFFWWVVFGKFGGVGDWKMQDMLLLYAVGTTAFGITAGLFGNVLKLSRLIAQGGLDAVLSMPPDPMHHILVSGMNLSAWGDLLFGLSLFALLFGADPAQTALFLVVSVLGAAVMLGFCLTAHSMAFWAGSAEGIAGLMGNALITFSLYPPGVFRGWTKFMLFTIVPAGFMTYLPAGLLREFSVVGLLELAAGAVAALAIGRAVFQAGLRRYESGSLVVARGA
ncbi:MAG: ABC-2 family transporter protein [Candidatus Wallbacteria bacterium]|nr:ABC-2 family transporter protein [Candidatus Wallbacteria bacterium]